MKVLETGTKGLNWTMKHRCTGWGNSGNGCEALLEIEKSDLRYFRGVDGDSWGSRDPAVTFKCPCCSTLTDLGTNDWPKDYRNLPVYSSSSSWIEETTVDIVAKVA
jgi:hypothetical protein